MDEHFIKIHKWLYPASWLYGAVVMMRNKLFDWEVLQSKSFDIPIISVGNLAVGGTGKTPHTEYLIKFLCNQYKVAVLSRMVNQACCIFLGGNNQPMFSFQFMKPFFDKLYIPMSEIVVIVKR